FFSPPPSPPSIYPLSLHDALPIFMRRQRRPRRLTVSRHDIDNTFGNPGPQKYLSKTKRHQRRLLRRLYYNCITRSNRRRNLIKRSEEHTSELQSPYDLVCRLLLEK